MSETVQALVRLGEATPAVEAAFRADKMVHNRHRVAVFRKEVSQSAKAEYRRVAGMKLI